LLCEAPDYFEGEAFEGVGFDEFVEIHVQEFGGDAEVAAEIETLDEVDHAVFVVGILLNVSERRIKWLG
jgi:hypothetical protein